MPLQRVFISHSWKDKPLARRIARRLMHRGVEVWLDEASMQVGDRISDKLAEEIRRSSHFVVLLSAASTTSKWVAQEIEIARAAGGIVIIPLIAEPNLTAVVLDESLGVDMTSPLDIEGRLEAVASAILGDKPRLAAAPDLLRQHLASIIEEAPELSALVTQLIGQGKLTIAQLEATRLTEQTRHSAETALIVLHDLSGEDVRYPISLVAARFYRSHGIGYDVLRHRIGSASKDHLDIMFLHLGDKFARPQDFDGAFRLFALMSPPPDQAFTAFVTANFDAFSEADRARAVELMLTPPRGPKGFASDAAYELFARMPEESSLQNLWWFWVNDYEFGGREGVEEAQRPRDFYLLMNRSVERGLKQFEPIMDHFESCFRGLARAHSDRYLKDLDGAVSLLEAAAQARYVHRRALANQLNDAFHSAEWDGQPHREVLYKSVTDFATAIANDEPYHDALLAYSKAFVAARDSAGNNGRR